MYRGTLDASGNTITTAENGVYLTGDYGTYAPADITVNDNTISDCTSNYGIYFNILDQGSLEIDGNSVTDCVYGIYVYETGYLGLATDTRITNNTVGADESAMPVMPGYGILVDYPENTTTVSNNTVSGYQYGMYLDCLGYDGSEPAVLTVDHNSVSGCPYGMIFDCMPWCMAGELNILNNIVSDSSDIGIWMSNLGYNDYDLQAKLKGNVLDGNKIGLYLESLYNQGVVSYVTLDSRYNGFIDNTVSYGHCVDAFTGVDATANWWNKTTGPTQITGDYYHAPYAGDFDMTVTDASFTPWITAIAPGEASLSLKKDETGQLSAIATLSDTTTVDVTDYTAAFTSSDATVATVSQAGLVTAIGKGTATITINCMGYDPAPTVTVTVTEAGSGGGGGSTIVPKKDPLVGLILSSLTGSLNANGGTFKSKDGKVWIVIPVGALTGGGSWQIAMIEVDPDSTVAGAPQIINGRLRIVGTIADIDITGLDHPFVARFYYDADEVTNPANLRIFYWNEAVGNWVPVSTNQMTLHSDQGYIEVTLTHCTRFAVMEVLKPVSFADVKDKWYADFVNRLALMGVTEGYTQNGRSLFKPTETITRAEFAVFLANALGLSCSAGTVFTDASSIPSWAIDSVSAAVSAGIVTGYNDNSFRPDEAITRAEMAVMIIRASGLATDGAGTITFADAASIPAWATASVAVASANGMMNGQAGNLFNPSAHATRAEAAKMIINLLGAVNAK